jgi:uncharacterized membrane protein
MITVVGKTLGVYVLVAFVVLAFFTPLTDTAWGLGKWFARLCWFLVGCAVLTIAIGLTTLAIVAVFDL